MRDNQQTSEDRATQPIDAGGWFSQLILPKQMFCQIASLQQQLLCRIMCEQLLSWVLRKDIQEAEARSLAEVDQGVIEIQTSLPCWFSFSLQWRSFNWVVITCSQTCLLLGDPLKSLHRISVEVALEVEPPSTNTIFVTSFAPNQGVLILISTAVYFASPDISKEGLFNSTPLFLVSGQWSSWRLILLFKNLPPAFHIPITAWALLVWQVSLSCVWVVSRTFLLICQTWRGFYHVACVIVSGLDCSTDLFLWYRTSSDTGTDAPQTGM